jgi:rhodanese-related sulfurtransferase
VLGRRPLVLDVRLEADYAPAETVIAGALRRDPERVAAWAPDLELGRPVVAYCVKGLAVSQMVQKALAARGFEARFLEGGQAAWAGSGGALAPKPAAPSLWVTRERPKIDRIACPWLIRRFVDPDARFLYVPPARVLDVAAETGAVPFDVEGVELTHRGDGCTFDTLLDRYRLDDPALRRLALIVRGADTGRPDLAPEAAGLLAISLGLSGLLAEDDHACLRFGLVLYDALWHRLTRVAGETHGWPPARPDGAAA